MSQQNTAHLGALTGKWNVPVPEKLKAALQPDREVESSFYASDLGLASRGSAVFEIYRNNKGAQ